MEGAVGQRRLGSSECHRFFGHLIDVPSMLLWPLWNVNEVSQEVIAVLPGDDGT